MRASTETTTEVISDGTPETSTIEIGRPWLGRRNSLASEAGHRIRHQHAREHEGVARVGAKLVELGLEALERQRVAGAVELAHLVDDDRVEIGQQIRDRAVDGDLAVLAHVLALGAGGKQALGEDVGVALPLGAVRGQEHFAMLLEVHQPVGQLQIVDVEQLAAALERGRIFAVRVDHHDVTLGAEAREMRWRISATEVDLPVPVDPSTAKCLPSIGST